MTEEEKPASIHGAVCPMPLRHYDKIVMGHGSGGRMTQDLIKQCFAPFLSNPALDAGNDYATLSTNINGPLAVSTDAHIVSPLIFPGGDIGKLAVCGTVNDVAMSGAVPLGLTASFILEEGLSTQTLVEIVKSMAESALEAGVPIVAGDTKVVERGKADGLFISTAGFGHFPKNFAIGGAEAKPGDVVLISGTLGDHGIAVLTARGDLAFETQVKSDVAPLNHMIQQILAVAPHVHVLRDPTRGGLATTLNEIAEQSQVNITIDEKTIPVKPAVQTACEMLGFDPLYVANEGKLIVIVPENEADAALAVMKENTYGKGACRIGRVFESPAGRVLLKTQIGATRVLDVMAGEMLPRIC
ncbi:MAG: hydrogenase expression/formation protein HypE [Chloroflexi bacterium HGW-Chloroflexi-5]|jgi:hydrogenase expression/formation protein HypE|nr:MAG: hydrogenase expression/formation protein HypE [Chloroflexi bacterium HGW-Chloroflexi-5]